eukprot:scaffold2067_cov379-Prasinococcus_capsulatus_cf.AAC.5
MGLLRAPLEYTGYSALGIALGIALGYTWVYSGHRWDTRVTVLGLFHLVHSITSDIRAHALPARAGCVPRALAALVLSSR